MKTFRSLAAALLVSALAFACDRSPTVTPSLSPSLTFEVEQTLMAEQDLVWQESEASRTAYDSLNAEWDSYAKYYEVTSSGIVNCEPLQYKADVKVIGPGGGDLSIGPHKLRIPRGALKQDVVITGKIPVGLWVGVRLSPEGLTFAKPVQLTLSYKHCYLPAEHRERVVQADDSLNVLAYPLSRDQTKTGVVDAWLEHFSNYAIAW